MFLVATKPSHLDEDESEVESVSIEHWTTQCKH